MKPPVSMTWVPDGMPTSLPRPLILSPTIRMVPFAMTSVGVTNVPRNAYCFSWAREGRQPRATANSNVARQTFRWNAFISNSSGRQHCATVRDEVHASWLSAGKLRYARRQHFGGGYETYCYRNSAAGIRERCRRAVRGPGPEHQESSRQHRANVRRASVEEPDRRCRRNARRQVQLPSHGGADGLRPPGNTRGGSQQWYVCARCRRPTTRTEAERKRFQRRAEQSGQGLVRLLRAGAGQGR